MPRQLRRAKGEGSITEYRKGHYRGFVDLGKDPNTGKRIRKTFTGSSKKEVIEKLNKYKYEKQAGILSVSSNSPFYIYIKHWLDLKEHTVKEDTYKAYHGMCSKYFLPILGSKLINEITTADINSFTIHPLMTVKKKTTQKTVKQVLSGIFSTAVKEGIIPSNPCLSAEPIKARKPDIHPLTQPQIQRLLEIAKQYYPMYYICKLAIETGARRGEILALTFDDINLKESTITFNKSINNQCTLSSTKTQTSDRSVYVSPETLRELYDLKHPDTNIIFHNYLGSGYISPVHVSYLFKKFLLKQANLPLTTRFHDLRHTNATILISKGIDMKTVSSRLGHSSIVVTMDRYAHAVKEEDKKAAEILSKTTNDM